MNRLILAWAWGLSIAWCIAFGASMARGAPLVGIGALSLVVVLNVAWRKGLRPAVSFAARDVAIGVAVGLVTLVATYGLYPVVRELLPSIATDVKRFYGAVPVTPLTLPVVVLVIVGEELLWRGAFLEALDRARGPATAVIIATFAYAVGQFGSGLPVLGAAAALLGGLWAVEALVTRSITAPLISHAMWTLTVFGIRPLET